MFHLFFSEYTGDKTLRRILMNRNPIILLSIFYILFMAFLIVFYQLNDNSYKVLVSIGGVICGVLPLLLTLFTRFSFHPPFILSYFVFLFCSQYLGSIMNWYGLGWWDSFVHFISGSLLAFTAILFSKHLTLSPWFIFLYSLSFAALGGVLWEIYEFSFDQLFSMTLQGRGITDTMTDLIADTLGGLMIAIWAVYKSKQTLM